MAPDIEAVAEQVFVALADPTRRAILAAGPATATDLAASLPITRQAIAKHLTLMADIGLVTPGSRVNVAESATACGPHLSSSPNSSSPRSPTTGTTGSML